MTQRTFAVPTATLFVGAVSLTAALVAPTASGQQSPPSAGAPSASPPASASASSAQPESPPPAASSEPSAPAGASAAPAPAPPPAPVPAPEPPAPAAPPPAPLDQRPEPPPPPVPLEVDSSESGSRRAPLEATVGEGARQVHVTLYGFLQTDLIHDTTRSYGDAIGDAIVARKDTYEGTVGRTQFSVRNTRIGLRFDAPKLGAVHPWAVVEGDFFGNQPGSPPRTSEAAYFDSPTFRLRHAYFTLENDYVDVVFGETYDVFGWQDLFFPCSLEFLGLPNQIYSRHAQVRLSHTFGKSGPIRVALAASAVRPAQRDSEVPDGNAGIRFDVESWKGIATPGNGRATAAPLSLGVSGTVRQFKVDAFTPPPTQDSNSVLGWGLSVDAVLPVIPARNAEDRGNKLTLSGSFVTGTGIGDLMNATGGATFPTLPNPLQASPAPVYEGNIDPGIVSFDTAGKLHTIDWRGFRVGLQYYLPPSGHIVFAANYTEASSQNLHELFPRGGAEIELLTHVADRSRYVDANLFWDATPEVRLGVSGAYTIVNYLDGAQPHNIRARVQGMYFF